MSSYVLEYCGGGGISENHCDNDVEALNWVECALEYYGYDAAELTYGDWGSDGINDDGEPLERMLIWADEASSINDPGTNAIASISRLAD